MKELPNIGTARAKKIVQLREEKGLTMKDLVLVTGILQKEWARLYQEGVILLPFEGSELVVPDTTPPSSPGAIQREETPPSPRSIMLQRQIEDMIQHHQQAMEMREAYFEKDRIKMIENMEALERQVTYEKAQRVADAKATKTAPYVPPVPSRKTAESTADKGSLKKNYGWKEREETDYGLGESKWNRSICIKSSSFYACLSGRN